MPGDMKGKGGVPPFVAPQPPPDVWTQKAGCRDGCPGQPDYEDLARAGSS